MVRKITLSNILLFLLLGIGAISLALFIATSKYNIVSIIIFSVVVIFLLFGIKYLLYYYLIFGALTFPGVFERIGIVSLNWIRTSFLAITYILYSIIFFKNIRLVIKTWEGKIFLIAIFPWIIYAGLTIIWSISPIDSMRYYPKFIMAAFLALSLLLDRNITSEQAIRMLVLGALIFFIISTVASPFKDILWLSSEPYFEGFSGRHPSKFYIVFISIFALSMWMTNWKKSLSLLLLSYSFILLVLIVQRGAFLAFLAGGLVIYFLSMHRISMRSIIKSVAILGISILGLYILFYSQRFQEYTFYPGYESKQFFDYIAMGDIGSALKIIDFKGRMELWTFAEELGVTLFGKGFGTTAVYLKELIGHILELHNDILQYLIELGYFGFTLYMIMWIFLFKLGYKHKNSSDKILKLLALSLAGYTAALFIWSFVDHVSNYSHMSNAYLFILAALTVKRILEIRFVKSE